jgi:hypothetical protein
MPRLNALWPKREQTAASPAGAATGRAPAGDSRTRIRENVAFTAVFFAALLVYALTAAPATAFNEQVRLADAILHGHLWVDLPSYIEHIDWRGHAYPLQPPLSGLILIPAVALWGPGLNQTAASIIIAAFETALAWRLLGRIVESTAARIWLTAFFGFGTVIWYEGTLGNSWGLSSNVSALATLLALNELFGKSRAFVVGLFAGATVLARYDMIIALPFYLALIRLRGGSLRSLIEAAAGFAPAGLLYILYNEARFGTVTDVSLALWLRNDPWLQQRMGGGSAWKLKFLPWNLYTLFFMSPNFSGDFPWIRPQMQGQALTLTSPAFVLALRSSFRRALPATLMLAAAAVMLPALFYHVNGFVQFGARYYIQCFPFLLALMALGSAEKGFGQMEKILVAASILLVGYGTWVVRTKGWG